jgi:hypothetical protein
MTREQLIGLRKSEIRDLETECSQCTKQHIQVIDECLLQMDRAERWKAEAKTLYLAITQFCGVDNYSSPWLKNVVGKYEQFEEKGGAGMRKISYRGKKSLRGCFIEEPTGYCRHYTKGEGNEPLEECEQCKYSEYYEIAKAMEQEVQG